MNGDEGDAIVSLDRMLPTSKDGIQVDKVRQIVYNIPQQADAMITGPISSPTSYGFFRDNFFPSFVALGAIRDVSLLYGVGRDEG